MIHQNQPVYSAGRSLDEAKSVMVMLHGRGAGAEDILSLSFELEHPDFAYIIPEARGRTWYPYSFLSPIENNEPHLTSALNWINEILSHLEGEGFSPERVMLLGFSQGACLCLEYAARNPKRYGGVAALSGGLIGPEGMARDYPGSLEDTPIFLGCSDIDPHIPIKRVRESTEVLKRMGANVTERIYPGMGHTVNEDEIEMVKGMMDEILKHKDDPM